jgi:hypothetical protein
VYPPGSPSARRNGDTIAVHRLPTCEFCLDRAEYAGQTAFRKQVFMCTRHFRQHGRGVGNGLGYRLVVTADDTPRG